MKAYRRLKIFIIPVFGFYASTGVILGKLKVTEKMFPILSWSLFAGVPNQVYDYALTILQELPIVGLVARRAKKSICNKPELIYLKSSLYFYVRNYWISTIRPTCR